MTLRPQIRSAAIIVQTAAIHALVLMPLAAVLGGLAVAVYCLFIFVRLLNRRDDPRHAKPPPDPP
jgi:hypothetical protein